jgi:hypothetical protein
MPSGESDEPWGMPFSLRKPSGRVLAVHVAFKHLRAPFEFGLPEGYPLRAACIARTHNQRSALNPPADWATVMFGGLIAYPIHASQILSALSHTPKLHE